MGLPELIQWLGKLHPAMSDFPIAILVSGAVAELLLMATRRPLFDAVSRFSVWFCVPTAAATATLGWFFAGFRLADQDWVLTTHRWLGTAAAMWAIVVLALSELSHHAGSQKSRAWFRLSLFLGAALIGVTGFFGGALIYGLDHYAW